MKNLPESLKTETIPSHFWSSYKSNKGKHILILFRSGHINSGFDDNSSVLQNVSAKTNVS